jgi:hypothetical protein
MQSLAEPALSTFFTAAVAEQHRAAQHRGVVTSHLRFNDLTVRVDVAGVGLADTLLAALAHRNADPGTEVHATIAIWEARTCPTPAVPFPWRESDIEPGGLVRGSDRDGVLAAHDTFSGALTVVDVRERAVLHRVRDRVSVPWWERAAPLRAALFWALGGQVGDLVHAGAVGDERGAVLLAGARGSGKTTVVRAAIARGLQFVADDYLLLRVGGDLEALSLYGTVSVRARSDDDVKDVLDVASLAPGSLRESLRVRAVVVPRIGGGHTELRRVSPGATLRAWAPGTALQMPWDNGAVVASLAEVVRRVPCFALDVGDDPDQLASAVLRALDEA